MSGLYENLDEDDEQRRCNKKKIIIGTVVGVLLLAIGLTITLTIILHRKKCDIMGEKDIFMKFPYESADTKYVINFNTTIMQANYVRYVSTSGGNGCDGCQHFHDDPYKINILKDGDYISSGYDRGHLVPNADYGPDTYIIDNVVPMDGGFNRGVWAKSEAYIREKYSGFVVYKGCEYTERFIYSKLDNKLYIPKGCYYVILDANHILKNYGYYLNQKDADEQSELPFWANCYYG
jgi:DNA/RNA endonuclease G (NUC1)